MANKWCQRMPHAEQELEHELVHRKLQMGLMFQRLAKENADRLTWP